ncbi:hypothetical protein CERSUDRAFT_118459 [Gelatoporia subvermispora B]|uniref:Uncharacterized protein n=1 Tax=Ceriporiopsis subvermispora (strain B) TaxID=914234 RepID=M2PAY3_CERS8|nr:hypothetical protein CERSUDRAFT_118459 [Gelatoporia subvermispora B]
MADEGNIAGLLPAPEPSSTTEATKLAVGTEVKLDALGPMVVNSDGTISRIANWQNLTDLEKERTMRVLVARNRVRIANQEKKLQEQQTTGAVS